MARTDEEVVDVLREIYRSEFGGKEDQRFLVSWADLRAIYGYGRLFVTRFDRLVEEASRRRLYVLDLGEGDGGHMVAVIRTRTVDRWRKAPRRLIDQYRIALEEEAGEEDDDE